MTRHPNAGPHSDPWLRSGIDGEAAPVAARPIRPKSLPRLFAQGKWWRRSSGEWVRVRDMHPAHRANAARLLLRDAADWAQKVAVAELRWMVDAPEDLIVAAYEQDRVRTADPVAWMRSTKLYRRLVKGLPVVPVHRGGCQVCDDRRASGELIPAGPDTGLLAGVDDNYTITVPVDGPPEVTYATDDAQIRADDARPSDPWEEAAQARALRYILALFEERLQRGGPYHCRALLQRDVRDMVADTAKHLGVTL